MPDENRSGRLIKDALQYQGALMTYAYVLLHDWALAEDAVQESMLVVIKCADTFEDGTNLFAWLKGILGNKVKEIRRSSLPLRQAAGADLLENAVMMALTRHLDDASAEHQQVRMRYLHDCMTCLDRTAVKFVRGAYWESKTYQALADEFGVEVEMIRKSLYRSRKRLAKCIKLRMKIG